jgi:hypothetical protein
MRDERDDSRIEGGIHAAAPAISAIGVGEEDEVLVLMRRRQRQSALDISPSPPA